MEVTAIAKQFGDDGKETFDKTEASASLTHPGSVSFSYIEEMVNLVIGASQYQKITRLNIIDHGAPSAQYIRMGKDKVTKSNIESYRAPFSRLGEKFDRKAIVHIQNCYAGKNPGLLRAIAKILGAPVYAGTGLHVPCIRIQLGNYVVVYPNGKVKKDVPRPRTPDATDELTK